MFISGSVGAGGINKRNDVKFIQELLTLLATEDMRLDILTADGSCGKKTKTAIEKYQRHIVKLKKPDQRIDPNGRSEKVLLAKISGMNKSTVADTAKKYGLAKSGAHVHATGPKQIVYRTNARKVLSSFTEDVIKLAMTYAGINKCDISSTLRTFEDQTRIMYNNCGAYPNATSVATLRSARGWGYAAAGRSVEEVYYAKKIEGQEKCKRAMKDKIEALYKESKKVSLHCVSEADYKNKNVLDIPYSSVNAGKLREFETALMGMTREIKNIRYKKPAQGEIYIDRLIIEDKCWHLELPQAGKKIIDKDKQAINVTTASKGPKTTTQTQTLEGALRDLLRYLEKFI